jgi:hypothetical protein
VMQGQLTLNADISVLALGGSARQELNASVRQAVAQQFRARRRGGDASAWNVTEHDVFVLSFAAGSVVVSYALRVPETQLFDLPGIVAAMASANRASPLVITTASGANYTVGGWAALDAADPTACGCGGNRSASPPASPNQTCCRTRRWRCPSQCGRPARSRVPPPPPPPPVSRKRLLDESPWLQLPAVLTPTAPH